MKNFAVRGACPTLRAPMLTGDGWLARLRVEAVSGAQLAGLARAAARFGNGRIEVTARGSLQFRGLSAASAGEMDAAVADLGIAAQEGLEARVGALAGIDPGEIADPRPLAVEIRRLAEGLALRPKVSVLVDGGGALGLGGLRGDLRLMAVEQGWAVTAEGPGGTERALGVSDAAGAVGIAMGVLERMARAGARARELDLAARGAIGARGALVPVGLFGAARGVGLPFGQVEAAALEALAGAEVLEFRPAPGRGLIAVGAAEDAAFRARAEALGFVTEPGDARLRIVACSGAPACGSAFLATRRLAAEIAADLPDLEGMVHLSGCAKGCARPMGPNVSLIASATGPAVVGDGMAVPDGMRAYLMNHAMGQA